MSDPFLTQRNASILWEVIADDNLVKTLNQNEVAWLQKTFKSILPNFHQGRRGMALVEENKQFINAMFEIINRNFGQGPPVKKPVTNEDFFNQRKDNFDRDLKARQEEFSNSMKQQAPEEPDFRDKLDDGPIENLEMEMKKMMTQRNYEIQNLQTGSAADASSWLQSQETSVKKDKLPVPTTTPKIPSNNSAFSSRTKTIKIGEEIDNVKNKIINLEEEKSVKWADEEDDNKREEELFLSKLKMKAPEKKENLSMLQSELPLTQANLVELKAEIKNLHGKLDHIIHLLSSPFPSASGPVGPLPSDWSSVPVLAEAPPKPFPSPYFEERPPLGPPPAPLSLSDLRK